MDQTMVVATFENADSARAAVDSLGRAGIDGGRIHSTGGSVAREANTSDTTSRDSAAIGRAVRPAVKASILGASVVGFLGFIASISLGSNEIIPGLSKAALVGGATICGVIIGGTIGALVAGIGSMDVAEDWELLLSGRHGPVHVEVVTGEGPQLEKVSKILRESGGTSIDVHHPRRAG